MLLSLATQNRFAAPVFGMKIFVILIFTNLILIFTALLVTGAKDGQILGWDLRAASTPRSGSSNAVNITDPSRKYSEAHPTMSDPASITSQLTC